jgi:hypothetical protein
MPDASNRYNRWLGKWEEIPGRCRTWVVNPSGYVYPVHSRAEGRKLVEKWNADAHSDRDVYNLRCI